MGLPNPQRHPRGHAVDPRMVAKVVHMVVVESVSAAEVKAS